MVGLFNDMDTNGDGRVTLDEFTAAIVAFMEAGGGKQVALLNELQEKT